MRSPPHTTGSRPRIAFLIPYTGTWPRWSPLFFASVDQNRLVDIILLCENTPPCILPPNVFIHYVTRSDLTDRLCSVTGLLLSEIWGHKLCDFKPFYGLAFGDMLQSYEFWGYCDVDLIFGDLSKLLTPEFLDDLDVFSAHHSSIVGHFTIIRNNDKMNRLCFTIENWREFCAPPQYHFMDEGGFAVALAKVPNVRWKKPDELSAELTKDFCCFGITFYYDGSIGFLPDRTLAIVEIQRGKAFYHDMLHSTEVLYVHFMGLKRWWHWRFFKKELDDYKLSSIGYGVPASARQLFVFPWKQIWRIQLLLTNLKSFIGSTLRKLLPSTGFSFVRRLVFGSGRY